MDQAPGRSMVRMVTPAGKQWKGRFSPCEGGFPLPRKQACREESRAAALRDGSSQAQRPSWGDSGVNADD